MYIHCKTAGILLILLACLHLVFPRYFRWKEELSGLQLINRQIMYVHTFFIGVTVLLMGLLCVTETEELVTTELGKKICLGFSAFWLLRLLFQLFVYSPRLWKGKARETAIHIVFTILWTYLCVVYYFIYQG